MKGDPVVLVNRIIKWQEKKGDKAEHRVRRSSAEPGTKYSSTWTYVARPPELLESISTRYRSSFTIYVWRKAVCNLRSEATFQVCSPIRESSPIKMYPRGAFSFQPVMSYDKKLLTIGYRLYVGLLIAQTRRHRIHRTLHDVLWDIQIRSLKSVRSTQLSM